MIEIGCFGCLEKLELSLGLRVRVLTVDTVREHLVIKFCSNYPQSSLLRTWPNL